MAPRAASSSGQDWYLQSSLVLEPEYNGSTMIFYQSAAPVGWTKNSSFNDCTLRLVSGTTGGTQSGTASFTTVYPSTTYSTSGTVGGIAAGTSGATALSLTETPSHSHPGSVSQWVPYPPTTAILSGSVSVLGYGQVSATGPGGGGGSHSHSLPAISGGTITATQNRALRYADVIIATKDF